MSERIVLLTTVGNLFEADLIKSKLESENIYCIIPDELSASIHPLQTIATGNIRIEVKESDLERAKSILNNVKTEIEIDESITKDRKTGQYICPFCESSNVIKEKYSKKFLLVSMLLIGFPIIFFSNELHCFNCNMKSKVKVPTSTLIIRIAFELIILSIIYWTIMALI